MSVSSTLLRPLSVCLCSGHAAYCALHDSSLLDSISNTHALDTHLLDKYDVPPLQRLVFHIVWTTGTYTHHDALLYAQVLSIFLIYNQIFPKYFLFSY